MWVHATYMHTADYHKSTVPRNHLLYLVCAGNEQYRGSMRKYRLTLQDRSTHVCLVQSKIHVLSVTHVSTQKSLGQTCGHNKQLTPRPPQNSAVGNMHCFVHAAWSFERLWAVDAYHVHVWYLCVHVAILWMCSHQCYKHKVRFTSSSCYCILYLSGTTWRQLHTVRSTDVIMCCISHCGLQGNTPSAILRMNRSDMLWTCSQLKTPPLDTALTGSRPLGRPQNHRKQQQLAPNHYIQRK